MVKLPKADTRPWNSWYDMIRRCERSYVSTYHYYGGRGIKVCDRWHSFAKFWEDMGETYKDGLTLERIDNDGNYEPENCKWVTMKEQCNNRRNSRYFTINGITRTLAQWIDTVDIKRSTVTQRYYVYGWSIEKSLGMEN